MRGAGGKRLRSLAGQLLMIVGCVIALPGSALAHLGDRIAGGR